MKWSQYLNHIVDSDHYISCKEYEAEIAQYSETMDFFISMDKNDVLEDYCIKNGFDPEYARTLCYKYEHRNEILEKINNDYIASKLVEEKEYLDNILKVVDPDIILDEDQRKVVPSQIRKSLISTKHIEDPVVIYTYDSIAKDLKSERRSGANYAMAYAVQTALEQIIKYNE